MDEKGRHQEYEDERADDQEKREKVRREEEAGVRYSRSDVFRELDERAETLEGGKTAGEQKLQEEQRARGVDEALTAALDADREKQEQEEFPADATFFSVEQALRPDDKLDAIADDSPDEQNLVGMLGACKQVGKEIFERKNELSFSNRAIFEQASKLLKEAETHHASALKAFRQHLLEGEQGEAAKDLYFFRESILGRSLETVTTQSDVLDRLKFTLDHPSKKERK